MECCGSARRGSPHGGTGRTAGARPWWRSVSGGRKDAGLCGSRGTACRMARCGRPVWRLHRAGSGHTAPVRPNGSSRSQRQRVSRDGETPCPSSPRDSCGTPIPREGMQRSAAPSNEGGTSGSRLPVRRPASWHAAHSSEPGKGFGCCCKGGERAKNYSQKNRSQTPRQAPPL